MGENLLFLVIISVFGAAIIGFALGTLIRIANSIDKGRDKTEDY